MPLLTQFVFRLAFGLALAMALTSPREITSGYYRNNLYALLGLNVLGALVAWLAPDRFPIWPPLAAAVISYLGAVFWLYEKSRLGVVALLLLSVVDLAAAWLSRPAVTGESTEVTALQAFDTITGGLLLGTTMAAMLLGHWYLNSPTMNLVPLRRLLRLMSGAIVLRTLVAGLGLVLLARQPDPIELNLALLSLRWLAGIVGLGAVTWMSWETLKIPNTQSATGILYVGVILSFLGELVAHLLSQTSQFPV